MNAVMFAFAIRSADGVQIRSPARTGSASGPLTEPSAGMPAEWASALTWLRFAHACPRNQWQGSPFRCYRSLVPGPTGPARQPYVTFVMSWDMYNAMNAHRFADRRRRPRAHRGRWPRTLLAGRRADRRLGQVLQGRP